MTNLSLWIINKDVMLIASASLLSIRRLKKLILVPKVLNKRKLAPRPAHKVVIVVVAEVEAPLMTKM